MLGTNGPNPSNIELILQTQSILFERYADGELRTILNDFIEILSILNLISVVCVFFAELRPYKYAGYPQLIKTIRLETKDEQLFKKEVPLLTAASELCYHTVYCSALNAEELRRESGIEVIIQEILFSCQLGRDRKNLN